MNEKHPTILKGNADRWRSPTHRKRRSRRRRSPCSSCPGRASRSRPRCRSRHTSIQSSKRHEDERADGEQRREAKQVITGWMVTNGSKHATRNRPEQATNQYATKYAVRRSRQSSLSAPPTHAETFTSQPSRILDDLYVFAAAVLTVAAAASTCPPHHCRHYLCRARKQTLNPATGRSYTRVSLPGWR